MENERTESKLSVELTINEAKIVRSKKLTIHITYSEDEEKIKKAEEAIYNFIAKEIL